jgi:hypothetical protein
MLRPSPTALPDRCDRPDAGFARLGARPLPTMQRPGPTPRIAAAGH